MRKLRISILALALSAAGFSGIALREGFTAKAIQPVPGDKPTYGLGSTVRADGKPVQMNDTITVPAAIALAQRDISLKESVLKGCMTGVLYQHEYDAFVSLAHNVGAGAVCASSIPGKVAAENYTAACRTILDFKKVQGRDCSLPANRHFCGGVWTDRQREYRLCMGEAP